MKLLGLWALAGAAYVCAPSPATAFPPYRSADATPATPYELGVRLGVGRVQWEGSHSDVTSPLLRASLGLPDGFEVISQLEYAPRAGQLADGALGGKWATEVTETVSVGVETFALLPVRPSTGGVGVESLLVATLRGETYRLHLNAGGFHDPRAGPARSGWRASALAETVPRSGRRVGFELFGKDSDRGRADVRAGVGLIYDFGRFDVRTAVHVGLSPAAPDVTTSLWVTTSFPVAR
jgi:hypothetical protein